MNIKCNVTKEELEQMCRNKMTNKQIAVQLGVSISSVNHYKQNFNLSNKYKRDQIHFSKEQIQNSLKDNTLQIKAAEQLRCNIATFRKFCKLYGIEFKGNRKDDNLDMRKTVLNYYQRGARIRNLSFELDEEDFYILIVQHCIYCNSSGGNVIPQKYFTKQSKLSFTYTGIDRLDPSKGYTKENSAPCCTTCNRAKRDMTENAFREWICKLIKFNQI